MYLFGLVLALALKVLALKSWPWKLWPCRRQCYGHFSSNVAATVGRYWWFSITVLDKIFRSHVLMSEIWVYSIPSLFHAWLIESSKIKNRFSDPRTGWRWWRSRLLLRRIWNCRYRWQTFCHLYLSTRRRNSGKFYACLFHRWTRR